MKLEMAQSQIRRSLRTYPAGLTKLELFARIECNVSYELFQAALQCLTVEGVVTEEEGFYVLSSRTSAATASSRAGTQAA